MKKTLKELWYYANRTDVQIGIRLFMVCLFMGAGQFAYAVGSGFVPVIPQMSHVLGLTAAEMAEHTALIDALKGEITKEVTTHVKAINDKGEARMTEIVEERVKVWKDLDIDKLKKVVEDFKEMNDAIAALKAKRVTQSKGKKANLITKAIEDNWKGIQDMMSKGAKSYSFKLETKVTSASFGDRVIFGFREAGIDIEALPEAFILDMISVMSGGPGSNPLSWIERNVVTAAAAAPFPAFVAAPTLVAEAATKPSMNFAWVENKMSSQTIAALVPVTKQAIFNYPMLEQEVRFELMRRIVLVLQGQILKGTGVGGQLKGLFTYAETFDTTPWVDTIVEANEYDVLVAAATQVLNNNFIPTDALITHTSKARMVMAKNANGTYVLPPFSTNDGLNVFGLRVKSTNVLVGDEFLVMDPKRALFNWVENPTIEIGLINDDFERNIWRIRCELQGMLRVKNHETGAFVKGDFSVAIADMLKP